MSKSKNSKGTYPHLVISTKEPVNAEKLADWLENSPSVLGYSVSVEYGQSGHEHVEAFFELAIPARADKVKEKIVKLFELTTFLDKKNTKVCFNHIDPDPMYGYGYTFKETPRINYNNLDKTYILECMEYYDQHCQSVNDLKAEIKTGYMTMDDIVRYYMEYLRSQGISSTSEGRDCFRAFLQQFSTVIPYSIYQKINKCTLTDYVDTYLGCEGGTFS